MAQVHPSSLPSLILSALHHYLLAKTCSPNNCTWDVCWIEASLGRTDNTGWARGFWNAELGRGPFIWTKAQIHLKVQVGGGKGLSSLYLLCAPERMPWLHLRWLVPSHATQSLQVLGNSTSSTSRPRLQEQKWKAWGTPKEQTWFAYVALRYSSRKVLKL